MATDRIRVRLRGFDIELVEQSQKLLYRQLRRPAQRFRSSASPNLVSTSTLFSDRPHVNKKSREQFEMRTHKRLIDILDPTSKVMDSLMKLELLAESM